MKKLLKGILICALIGAILLISLMTAIFACAKREYPAQSADCIIVLGARVWMDGELSLTLRARVDAALAAYQSGTANAIIVCGGQGGDEPISEARAMMNYLTAHGVEEENIFSDETSVNTKQNLQNAQAIMREHNMTTAAIVTSDYHLTRAMWLAKDLGIDACGIKADTPIRLSTKIANYARESLSWVFYWIRRI